MSYLWKVELMTNLRQRQRCLFLNFALYWKPKQAIRRKITTLVQFVCHLAMLEGVDSFYNYVSYDKVTKMHYMQLCALDGVVQLENTMPTKRIDIKLVDNKPTLTL